MNQKKYNESLFTFIKKSPTQYHAVANMAKFLVNHGFTELKEGDSWTIKAQSKYFVTRNGSSIIAFLTGDNRPWERGIKIVGAHTDSPCLKVKPIPEIYSHEMTRLGVEVYGGVLLNSWFDRGLNLAGRVTVLAGDDKYNENCDNDQDEENAKENKNDYKDNAHKGEDEYEKELIRPLLINYDAPIATIPSLAIHLDREANTKRVLNPQIDMPPLLSVSELAGTNITKISFREKLLEQVIKEYSNINIKKLFDFDMSFSDAQPPFFTGINQEMISAPRLDNLLSCHAAIKALARFNGGVSDSSPDRDMDTAVDVANVHGTSPCIVICTDHEEVGSDTASGARGSFLNSVLSRLIPDTEKRIRAAAKSFMISLDNAHAIHPAHPDLHDSHHTPLLNQGPVLKMNASQRYTSDCESSALFRYICKIADVPMQTFVMRSDMPCGSTIGPAISAYTGIKSVDAGAPTLGMHAIREITGTDDPFMVFKVINQFFSMESLPLLSLT